MIRFNKTNIYKIHLTLIRNIFEDGSLDRILQPIGEAIKNCEENIDAASSTNNEDYIDSVVDYEVEIIENLLGTSFIACQTYITGIVSRIVSLHKYHNGQKPNKLTTTGNKKLDILSFGDKPKNIKYTKVQLIDSFANYFKHRDEWNYNWDKATGKSTHTIKIIKSVGLKSGSSGNLRTAAKSLGNSEFKNIEIFYDIIYNWCKNLYDDYQSELKKLKLI